MSDHCSVNTLDIIELILEYSIVIFSSLGVVLKDHIDHNRHYPVYTLSNRHKIMLCGKYHQESKSIRICSYLQSLVMFVCKDFT